MALTEAELSRLAEIDSGLQRADPRLHRAMIRHRAPRPTAGRWSMAAGSAAAIAVGIGIGFRIPALCMVAWFAMLVSVTLGAIATS